MTLLVKITNYDLAMAAVALTIFFVFIVPLANLRTRRQNKAHSHWAWEERWTTVDYAGKKYPIRNGEKKEVWSIMNPNDKWKFQQKLEKAIREGKLVYVDDPVEGQMLMATKAGRQIEYSVYDYWKKEKKNDSKRTGK